jgi:hypothetical protein
MRNTRLLLCACAALLALAAAGCNNYVMYALFGRQKTEKVQAEYADLRNGKLAVVVYIPPSVESDYPEAQGQLTRFVINEFGHRIRNGRLKNLDLVDADTVRYFQESTLNWEGMDRTEIARKLGADFLLVVSIMEFSTREYSDATDLYRGRLLASATLYDAHRPESRSAVWPAPHHRPLDPEVYPEHGPQPQMATDDGVVRVKVMSNFADKLAKRFYNHKVVIEDDQPSFSQS